MVDRQEVPREVVQTILAMATEGGPVPVPPPILAALCRAWLALEDGWKPIETAPRDGTTVVVYFKGHGPMTVAWEDPWGDGPEGAVWCVTDHKHGPYPVRGYSTGDDTHWLPLPGPPAIDQARRKEARNG